MDTFPLNRMSFDGKEMIEDPPRQEQTGRLIRDPKDPEFVQREATYLDLNSESDEWWT